MIRRITSGPTRWRIIASVALGVAPWQLVSANTSNPEIGFVLDGFYKSESSALSERSRSFGLGHTELFLESAVDDLFTGRLTSVLESHEGATELDIEEAFIDTVSLPLGLDLRAGRFLSQVGYLNSHHTHSDAFAERPAVYRALLGGHYFDDGVRLSTLLPLPFYTSVGIEAFNGQQLAGGTGDDAPGVWTLSGRVGGDLSESSNWQAGLSWLRHELTVAVEEEEEVADEEEHDHSHDAAYSGKNMMIIDAVWKWSPRGNVRDSQLMLSGEYLRADDISEFASDDDRHEGWYLSAAYRWNPQWQLAFRYGEVDLKQAHGDHFHDQNLEETEVALSWSRSHFSTVRAQYTQQSGDGFDDIQDSISLQYVMSLGMHGAHDY